MSCCQHTPKEAGTRVADQRCDRCTHHPVTLAWSRSSFSGDAETQKVSDKQKGGTNG